MCTEIDKCLHRLEFDEKLAVATSRYHIKSMPLQQNIFCFDQSQNIHNYLNTFMIRNDFPMKHEFDNILKRIVTSGILSKWRRDLQLYRVSVQFFFEIDSLNLIEFSYAFILLGPFLIVTVFILIVEFHIYKRANSVNTTNFWQFLDKIICGKRCFFLLEPRNDDVVIPFTK